MTGEWPLRPLGELTENFDSIRVPVKEADRRPGLYPYYGASGIVDYIDGYLFDGEYLLIAEDGENLRTRTTPIGFLARGKFWVNNHAHIVRGNSEADTRFLMYALANTNVSGYLTGSTMPKLTQGNLNKIHVPAPPLQEQKAVAAVLGTLDDRIELNRKMNETLEGIARALFKSWFVDFDPVRAKNNGQSSGLPPSAAAVFPSSFQDSELGEIPTGWKVGVLDELTDFVIGGDWGAESATNAASASASCIRGADIPELQRGGFGRMPKRYLKESSLAKRQLRSGDLVIEISGGSPTQSTGRPVLISEGLLSRREHPLVCSNFCRLLRLKNSKAPKFVYSWLRWLYDNNELLQFENGTTGIKNFAFGLFSSSYKLVTPSPEALDAFDSRTSDLFYQQQVHASESEILAAIRDALLPKLISGRLLVSDAARVAGGHL